MKRIVLLLLFATSVFAFDPSSVFNQNVEIFEQSDNPYSAIKGFEDIVNAYDLGEIKGPEAFEYYIRSLEYLCVLYSNKGETQTVQTLFEKIVRSAPHHRLTSPFISPTIVKNFDAVRARIVGFIRLACNVEDPEIQSGTLMLKRDASGRYPIPGGEWTIVIRKVNHEPVTRQVTVPAGGEVTVEVSMTRTSAAIAIMTDPVGVSVFLDGVQVGETSGKASADYLKDHQDTVAELGLNPGTLSDYLVINGVAPGDHVVELKKPCYKPARLDLTNIELRDYYYKPIQLYRSIGYLIVEPGSPDETGDLFLDGRRVGTLPVNNLEVCSGKHQLKVAFENGTFIKTVEVAEGEHHMVRAVPKPTLLFAGIQPIDENHLIINQVMDRLTAAFGKIELFNMERDDSYTSAIDRLRTGDEKVLAAIRESYGQSLVVFGVEKRVKLKRYVDIFLLNTEMFHPEQWTIDPSDSETMEALVRAVRDMPDLTEETAHLVVVQDPDRNQPIVVKSLVPDVRPGDLVSALDGQEIADAQMFYDGLKAPQAVLRILRDGAEMEVTVPVVVQPVTLRQNLKSLSYNAAFLTFHSRMVFATNEVEKAAARLNLAMCYLRFREFERAFDTLSLIQLPDGPGVSAGTVAYLKGLCYQEIGSWMDLQTQFRNYQFSDEATVINSQGMRVRDLIDFTFEYLRKQ